MEYCNKISFNDMFCFTLASRSNVSLSIPQIKQYFNLSFSTFSYIHGERHNQIFYAYTLSDRSSEKLSNKMAMTRFNPKVVTMMKNDISKIVRNQ